MDKDTGSCTLRSNMFGFSGAINHHQSLLMKRPDQQPSAVRIVTQSEGGSKIEASLPLILNNDGNEESQLICAEHGKPDK